jgi:hypothetical protein
MIETLGDRLRCRRAYEIFQGLPFKSGLNRSMYTDVYCNSASKLLTFHSLRTTFSTRVTFPYLDCPLTEFALSLPDINQVLKGIPSGKLLPFGIFKLLSGLKPKAKKINRVRVITLGVVPEYRASGLASVFYYEAYKAAETLELNGPSEMSWILEDNRDMVSAIEAFSGRPAYKTFRMYDKAL